MSSSLPKKTNFISRIPPSLVAWMIVLGILVWAGLQSIALFTDGPISTDAIQAQQIRVKTGQLVSFQTTLESYQAPEAPVAIKTDLFKSPSDSE